MADLLLDIDKHLTGVGLVPAPVHLLGRKTEQDEEIAGEVLGLDFAAFFAPKPQDGSFMVAHNNSGVGPADEVATLDRFSSLRKSLNVASSVLCQFVFVQRTNESRST